MLYLNWVSSAIVTSLVLSSPLVLTGCLNGGAKQSTEGLVNKDFSMLVREIYQQENLGKLAADGQFVIMKISIKNNTPQTREMKNDEFTLEYYEENDTGKRATTPTYIQKPEAKLKGEFTQEFGPSASKKLISPSGDDIHPRIETMRYFIFSLPKNADFDDYKLTWTPTKKGNLAALSDKGSKNGPASKVPISINIINPEHTEVRDRRQLATY